MKLDEGVFLARIDDRSVVLDLQRDRYFALTAPMTRGVFGLVGADEPGASAGERTKAAAALERMSINLANAKVGRPLPPPPLKTLWAANPDAAARDAIPRPAVLWALACTAARLRLGAFRQTIEWAETRIVASPTTGRGCAKAAVDAYAATRPWFPVKPVCRLDAIALSLILADAGCTPRLVFGVRLEPFHAHCWVEAEGQIVNEAAEDLVQYVPILSVGGGRA